MPRDLVSLLTKSPPYVLEGAAIALVLMLVGAVYALRHWRSWATNPPLWKRKGWIIVAVLWLVVLYPLSTGPVSYALGRRWISMQIVSVLYHPLFVLEPVMPPGLKSGLAGYNQWWRERGQWHDIDQRR